MLRPAAALLFVINVWESLARHQSATWSGLYVIDTAEDVRGE